MRNVVVGLFVFCLKVFGQSFGAVDIGGILLSVSDSSTAQIFHVVDQLSEWDEACHRQYGRWAARELPLDDRDRQLLQKHAGLRRARGWGRGFEQAFYVDESIDEAARKAVETKILSSAEAAAEQAILLHFSSKLSGLLREGAPRISAFKRRLTDEGKRIDPFVRKLVRFSETEETVRTPVFLVPNPEEGNGGGGFNGGRLVLEVQERPDPLPTLFHECLHALLYRRKDAIEATAKSVGLRFTALNEGIAYALAPGLTDDVQVSDSLAEALVRSTLKGTPASNSYVQSYLVALTIRPLLRAALERGETISAFLPEAAKKWKAVSGGRSLESIQQDKARPE